MIGCDIVEIDRIRNSIEKFGEKFLDKILTENEKLLYKRNGCKAEFIAGRFAAKEAVSKAIGSGMNGSLWFTDIEVLPDINGKPIVSINKDKCEYFAEVTISHSKSNAIAFCMIKD